MKKGVKAGFYPKLAVSNIKNNQKMYRPYLLMSSFIIMIYYIINAIIENTDVKAMPHSTNIITMLKVGNTIVSLFCVIFLFYINSFLMRQRKKEIGLYNILGLGKGHLAKMMLCESTFMYLLCTGAGLILGIIFNKLVFMLLYKLIHAENLPGFEISGKAIQSTMLFFLILFAMTFIYNIIKVQCTNPIELLHGGQMGEKEPKAKLVLTIIGFACIIWGYGFAILEKSPLNVMRIFLLAVVAVAIGTYALFTSGSIAGLKLLKKNKKYYYHPKHFSVISGMLYRMKQNAVGLASICILSTMALISVSTTVCMYARIEEVMNNTCPNDINMTILGNTKEDTINAKKSIGEAITQKGVNIQDLSDVLLATTFVQKNADGSYSFVTGKLMDAVTQENTAFLSISTQDDFNDIAKDQVSLAENEVLLYTSDNEKTDKIALKEEQNTQEFSVKRRLEKSEISSKYGINEIETLVSCVIVVVKDQSVIDNISQMVNNAVNMQAPENAAQDAARYGMTYYLRMYFDTDQKTEDCKKLCKDLRELELGGVDITIDNRDDMRIEYYQMYGSFLFMGILFGTLFILATAIIIYYKQISEGYEDRDRFAIMQKVGMSYAEVKSSIKSQVLAIFSLPIIVAGLHVLVSFRIIKMILALLSMGSTPLFVKTTIGTYISFIIIYVIVYLLTARSYYKIVKA